VDQFGFYFTWGIDHILTWEALDHILFIAALCLRYLLKDWKKVAIMITAFTIGHSITLALSALHYVNFSTDWIEFLVPVTIVITAAANLLVSNPEKQTAKLPVIYFFALFFGLIHGLAYASTLMLEGEKGLVAHLFAFNVGIELAQLLVVAVVLLISFILVQLLKLSRIRWIQVASVIILMLALKMTYERFPNNKKEANAKASIVPVGWVNIM
jgi:HupE / UreJ protein